MTSKEIGRKLFLRYCLLNLAIIFMLPTLIGLFNSFFNDEPFNIFGLFAVILIAFPENLTLIICEFFILAFAVWLIGGKAGRLIIDEKYPPKVIGFFSFFILWLIFYFSCMLISAFIRSQEWGYAAFFPTIVSWLVFGLFLFLFLAIVNGALIGILFGIKLSEWKSGGRNSIEKKH